jgi:aminobenzoyl-glutamate utilization protein B
MTDREWIEKAVEQKSVMTLSINDRVWEYAELPYEERRSADLLCETLEAEGFTVRRGVAEIPTAFTATYTRGTGRPTMGILGEYDALAALSQQAACPVKKPVREGAPGHGCGHCALGAGALAAAVALKDYLDAFDKDGAVVYYGCAAEEGAGAKQFMARAGLFDGVDFVYTWHPSTMNRVQPTCSVAIMGANMEFAGRAAHAGATPHLGRSALDAAELMSVGCNYLREHMIDGARVHYAYVDAGGTSPNVVQDHALLRYEVRSPKVAQVKELFARVVNVGRGAAIMTDTKFQYEITMAFSDYIPNDALAAVADECLAEIGPPAWSDDDYALAKAFLDSYDASTLSAIKEDLAETYGADRVDELLSRPLDSEVHPYDPAQRRYVSGSTDVGDVGYAAPTLNLNVATVCLGNVGHSWQSTAQACSPLAHKGLLTAAKWIALCCARTMERPGVIEAAKAEVLARNGGRYACPLPDEVRPPVGRY